MLSQTPEPVLLDAWQKAKAADPGARTRDIADMLGVPEGLVLEARTGREVRRLGLKGPEFIGVLEALKGVGSVMTLTRNDACVHETTGEIGEVAAHGAMGQVVGEIDLRLFLKQWHVGYAIEEETRSGLRHSVQVFDTTGRAVIKIYASVDTDMVAWEQSLAPYLDMETSVAAFSPAPPKTRDAPDSEIDVEVLREQWQALEHSHDFHKMLRELSVGREQALRLAGGDLASRIRNDVLERLLRLAAEKAVPIMCFVGNPGCIQIFSGEIQTVQMMGPWLNVMDPKFNLHLRTDRAAGAWVVRKPTSLRGVITSLELFDADGELICQFFGARPPGEGEREAWREIVKTAIGAGS
ncbi:MAG: ChuX/HutX family heme-like substrate-binding protein [Pseudomonadota bacterium]